MLCIFLLKRPCVDLIKPWRKKVFKVVRYSCKRFISYIIIIHCFVLTQLSGWNDADFQSSNNFLRNACPTWNSLIYSLWNWLKLPRPTTCIHQVSKLKKVQRYFMLLHPLFTLGLPTYQSETLKTPFYSFYFIYSDIISFLSHLIQGW